MTVSLNTINELVFVMEITYLLCEVGGEFLYIIYMTVLRQGIRHVCQCQNRINGTKTRDSFLSHYCL